MSNVNRQAAGTKQAGQSVGGQFAASQKTEASGAGLTPAPEDPRLALARQMREQRLERIAERQQEIVRLREEMHLQNRRLFEHEMALTIRDQVPEATHLVLGRTYDGHKEWSFAGVEGADEQPLDLSVELDTQLDRAADETGLDSGDHYADEGELLHGTDPSETPYGDWDEIVRIDLAAAEQESHVDVERAFLDTGQLTEKGFNSAYAAAVEQLNLGANNSYTRGDMQEYAVENFVLENGDSPSDEQLAQIADLASREYADGEPSDTVYELEAERRDDAIQDAAKQLGLKLVQG
ncbi:hypothetical protein ACXR2T_10015 [Leucobacter sp. HY1910]